MASTPARASASSAAWRCARRSMSPKRRGGSVMLMLSATERSGISESSWKTQAMPAARASDGDAKVIGSPSRSIRPSSGGTTPAMILIRVDLPAPFSPRTAWIRPARTVRSAPAKACTPPYRFETPRASNSDRLVRERGAASAAAVISVRLGLSHDLLRGEVDAAGRERVADEEIVVLRRVVVRSLLHGWILGFGERQFDSLRYNLALQRGDSGLDRHRDLRRPGTSGRALQALVAVLPAELPEAVLGLTSEGDKRMLRVDHGLHH